MYDRDPSVGRVLKILKVLDKYDHINITSLALVTRINHHRLIPTLDWMSEHVFLIVTEDGAKKEVSITEEGREYIRLLRRIPLPSM
jgi:predicted transcriptional regulator